MEPIAKQGVTALRHPAVVAAHRDAPSVQLDSFGAGPFEQPDASPQQLVLEGGRHLGVLAGQHLLAADDQRDPAPKRAEHVHELHAGHPRADDDEVLGHDRRRVGLPGGEDPITVRARPIRDAGPAAGGDQDGVGVELLDALRRSRPPPRGGP